MQFFNIFLVPANIKLLNVMWMKIILLVFFFYSNIVFSQEFEELCDDIQKFKTSHEFDAIECDIFLAVGHVVSQPYLANKMDNSYAIESIMKWLEGTANYHLIVGGKILEDCDQGDVTMKNIFKICMLEFLFSNHEYVHTATKGKMRYINIHEVREIIFGGTQLFMEYLSKQNKKVINKKLYKGLKLYREGQLQEYIDS